MRSPDKPRHSRLARLTALAVAAALSLPTLTGCARKTPPVDPDTTTWFPLPTLPTGASTWYPPGWTSTSTTPTALPTTTTDPLYQEAVQVYQRFFDAYNQIQLAGGADELPPELAGLLTGPALNTVSDLAALQKSDGIRYLGSPEFRLHWTRPYIQSPPDGALAGIETCEETIATIVNAEGQEVRTSGDTWQTSQVFFQRVADKLAILRLNGDWVESCPA